MPDLRDAPRGILSAAARLAEAIDEAARDPLPWAADALSDDALRAVGGGTRAEVHAASAGFLSDWRRDEHPLG